MRYRPLGKSGIDGSVVAIGTWAIGGWLWGGTDEQRAIDALLASMDLGVNLIDTAPVYGLGLAEEIVGKAVAGRRDKVVLATKCGLVTNTDKGVYHCSQYGKPVHRYLGGESIRRELENSLKRLRTDYIDLYQTHRQDPTTPIEQTMDVLLDLKRQGKIRAIGVSNVTVEQMRQYTRCGQIDSDQEQYNMIDRHIEADLLPFCRDNEISVLAYSPLGRGLLTGKIGPAYEFSGDDHRKVAPIFRVENRAKVAALLQQIKPIADDRKLTLSQLVIAWTVAQPGITHALVGARDRHQAQQNAQAGDVVLTAQELAAIAEAIETHVADIRDAWFASRR